MSNPHPHPSILHISTAKTWRGGEQQLTYLYEELNTKDIQQILLCAKHSAIEQYYILKTYKHYSVRKGSNINLLFARKVREICREHEIDIIHVHDSHALSFALLAANFFGNDTSLVVSRRVDFPVKSKRKYNHPNIKKILCVSDAIREITGRDIVNKSVLKTVYSGIDLDRFPAGGEFRILREEYNLPPEIKLIGNVAALAPHKDYFTFLDTVELLLKEDLQARFFIIGEGKLEDQLRRYAQNKGLNEHVIFTGFRDDISRILPELDLFLITSETEGFGTTILDAFACRVPVVATDAGGIPEIVEDNVSGILGGVKRPETLAAGVKRIFSDGTLRDRIVLKAYEKVGSFTKEVMADKTLNVYQDIFSGNHDSSLFI